MEDFVSNTLVTFQQPLIIASGTAVSPSAASVVTLTNKVLVKAFLGLQAGSLLGAGSGKELKLIVQKSGVTIAAKTVFGATDFITAWLELDFGPQGIERGDYELDYESANFSPAGLLFRGTFLFKD